MKKTLLLASLLFIIFLLSGCSLQKSVSVNNNQQVQPEINTIPTLGDYSIEKRDDSENIIKTKSPIIIDFQNNPKALEYRTALKDSAKKGPNFAGNYAIATWGCGTECQGIAVIDGKNGKVYFPNFGLELGIDFDIESNLLIVNPPENIYAVYGSDINKWPEWANTKFYEWKDNEFKLIKSVKIPKADTLVRVIDVNQPLTTSKTEVSVALSKSNKYSSLKWQTATIQEENRHAGINIKYPEFIGGLEIEPLNKYISDLVFKKLSDDKASVQDWIKSDEFGVCHGPLGELDYYPECSVLLNNDYKVYSIINDVVSLELVFTNFTGGGNGNHDESVIVNYDLKTNRPLKTSELFCHPDYLNKLAPIVKVNLNDIVRPILDIGGEIASDERKSIEKATNPASDYYNNILLGYSGLTMVFPSYSVTSGGIGIVRVFVPYIKIADTVCLP